MSYCRFENTADNLEDCFEAISENSFLEGISDMHEEERQGLRRLLELCRNILTHEEDINECEL